jgi:nucleoside-diphosphate-sugar epimerase
MNVVLTGATGFIGRRLMQALLDAGHRVVVAGSPAPGDARATSHPAMRFSLESSAADWQDKLRGIDVAVNAVGIFRENGAATFDAVHVRGPQALFAACLAQGVRRVVQVSALGADAAAATAYHASKRTADAALLALAAGSAGALEATVVQPSLVFGPEGASADWFLTLAALPVLPLPGGGRQCVQPVHVDDAVAAIVALVEAPPGHHVGERVPLVGPRPLTLAGYLQALRRGLGLPVGRTIDVPAWAAGRAARLGDFLPGSLLDSASWSMLQRGSAADAASITGLLGRPPREPGEFVPADTRAALRARAQLAWLRWLLRGSLAVVWLLTAVVSLGVYPVEASYDLLGRAGVPSALRPAALYGAAALDLAFGVLTLWPLGARSARWLWRAQAALVVGYTLIISLRLPEFWLHPYGPLSKNLPILAVLWLLHATEPRPADTR